MYATTESKVCMSQWRQSFQLIITRRRRLTAIILMAVGSLIYLVCRQDVIFISWIDHNLLNSIYLPISGHKHNILFYIFLYCLPDALWFASLLMLQIPFVRFGTQNKLIFLFSVLLPFLLETMQCLGLIIGTFDWLDIITYFITIIIFVLCERKQFINWYC